MQNLERMRELIQTINEADEAYYKYDAPIMADLDYDRLYDELVALERETGTILSSSPTQRVSGEVLESLTAVRHTRPMLSADKCKSVADKIDDDHIADIIQGRPTILPQEVRDVIFTKVRSYACDILDKLRELQVDLRANPAIFIGGGSILFRSFVEESPLVAHADFVTDPKANAIGYGMLATAQLRRMAPQNHGGEFFAQG